MNFFKELGEGKGQKKGSSLFGGMKIKGAKEAKINKVQNQTNLSIPSSTSDIQKSEKSQKQVPTVKFEEPQVKISEPVQDSFAKTREQESGSEKNEYKIQEEPTLENTKTISEEEQAIFAQNDDKKYSASEACHNFQKKRDRKKSNPFLNQIKKNPRKETANLDDQKQEISPNKTEISPTKKSRKKTEKEELMEELNNGHIKMIEFHVKQKQVKQAIIQIASGLGQMKEELNSTLQLQFSAVEKQEYEQAEKYQIKIQNLQSKVEEQEIELSFQQEQFYKHEYEQLSFNKSEGAYHKKMIRKIKLVEMQLNDESSNLKRSHAEFKEDQQIKIENENKKIIRLQNDINFQNEQLTNLEKQFKEDLDSRRDPLLSQLQESTQKKIDLEKQIEELQNFLKKKKNELKEVNEGLKEIKKQINEVEETFKEQGTKLNDRKNKLKKLQDEKSSLSAHLADLQDHLKQESKKFQEDTTQLLEEAKNLQNLAKKIEEDSMNFEDKMEDKKAKVDTFVHNTKALKQFEEQHKSTKDKVKELEFKKANISAEANKLQQKRIFLKNLLPKLESEQKALAAAKNFKGAGMKKNQIKEANEEIEVITKKIESCFVEEKKVQEEITKIEGQQQKFIDEQNEIRKNLAISQFRFNLEKYKEIKSELKWLKSAKDIKLEKELKKKYQEALQEQIENLEEEIKYIGEQYELSVDLDDKPQQREEKQQTQEEEEPKQKKQETDHANVEGEEDKNENLNESKKESQKEQKQSQKQDEEQMEGEEKKEEHHEDQQQEGGYVPLQLD